MDNEKKIQETMASEIVAMLERQCERLTRLGVSAIIALTLVIIGLLFVNWGHSKANERNNQRWIAYLSEYDFVTQDGDGYNYFNSNVVGDVINGEEDGK